MRPVVAWLLMLVVSDAAGVRPTQRTERLQWCSRVCQDRLVPCGNDDGHLGGGKRWSPGAASWRQVRGLTPRQRLFCRRHPELVPALLDGARRGLDECRRRFRRGRWNCHALGQHLEFGHVQVKGTPEAAVQYALYAAAITHAIYRACQRGSLSSCSCGRPGRRTIPIQHWKWSGCLGGIKTSAKISRRFVNARELEGDVRSKMNMHNNRAGIRMATHRTRRRTICHGLSGSCAVTTSWRELPRSFTAIGASVAAQRDRSLLVVAGRDGGLRTADSGRRPGRSRLVHLVASPSYCEPDPETGFQGTAGRPCRRNSSVAGSCEELCCGRGHTTEVIRQVFCCNFHTNSAKPSRCRQKTRVRTCN